MFCFVGYICPLLAEDTGAVRYQDSILKVADALPATLVRLTYLRDMAYKHQYAPYNMTFFHPSVRGGAAAEERFL